MRFPIGAAISLVVILASAVFAAPADSPIHPVTKAEMASFIKAIRHNRSRPLVITTTGLPPVSGHWKPQPWEPDLWIMVPPSFNKLSLPIQHNIAAYWMRTWTKIRARTHRYAGIVILDGPDSVVGTCHLNGPCLLHDEGIENE